MGTLTSQQVVKVVMVSALALSMFFVIGYFSHDLDWETVVGGITFYFLILAWWFFKRQRSGKSSNN